MPRACVLLANGFEEIEAMTIIDVLRRAEVDLTTLSVGGSGNDHLAVTGSHEVTVRADRTLTDGAKETWDLVILPGGLPGATNLRDSAEVQALIRGRVVELFGLAGRPPEALVTGQSPDAEAR